MRAVVHAYSLGRVSYQHGLDVQARICRRHLDFLAGVHGQKGEDVLLLMEHDPVYTIGIRRKDYTMEDEGKLRRLGADFFKTNRGGLITFHGPGQLIAYPIINLKNYKGLSLRCYVDMMQNVLIHTCNHFGVPAQKTDDPGAWVDNRKIGAIGVNVRRFITHHGVSLNCDVDLSWFEHIVPCGITGKKVSSLSAEKNEIITVSEVTKVFCDAFKTNLNCDLVIEENVVEAC